MPTYLVKQGDCLSSIGQEFGMPWKKIWNHPDNNSLKAQRGSPNILKPGDRLFIPEPEGQVVSAGCEARHRFRLKEQSSSLLLRLRLLEVGEELDDLSGEEFSIEFDTGATASGTTESDGTIRAPIPRKSKSATLSLGSLSLNLQVQLGHLDPVDEASGVQARLSLLGYPVGPVDGIVGDRTRAAVRAFQADHRLTVDGIAGPNTQARLREVFGS